MLRLRSYAKINLYLDVLGKRPDGYHNLETIFQSVDLFDELRITRAKDVTLVCADARVPAGEENLIIKSARLLQRETGFGDGARIELRKHVPMGAGLAGGSGNAAMTLIGLNSLWKLGLSDERLLELGLELGSDVPFCLTGGTQAATGRGELLEPLPPVIDPTFVLVHFPIHVSTASVFNDPAITFSREGTIDGKTPSFRRAIENLKRGEWDKVVFNRLEDIVFARHRELARAKDQLLNQLGCLGAVMSGTGSTIVGVFDSFETAESCEGALSGQFNVSLVEPETPRLM